MSPLVDISAFITAFFAGLLGSGHCFGMCGGIATGLGTLAGVDSGSKKAASRIKTALLFNFGRILSYAVLGMLAAWLLSSVGQVLNVPKWGMILRFVTALMIFLIGLQFIFDWQLLAVIERVGARVWKLTLPLAVRVSSLPGGSGRLLLGLCWGLLPCGLVYSVLFTASATGSPLAGALVMAAFGAGTLPSMLGMSLTAPALAAFLTDRWTRRLIGIALVLLAFLSVSLMIVNMQSRHDHAALVRDGFRCEVITVVLA